MGYLSFDASVKIHASGRATNTKSGRSYAGGVDGYLRHVDRANEKKDGKETEHSNPNINARYTADNDSYYKDDNGNWQVAQHSEDIMGAVDRRLQYARDHGARITDKGKNDTVIVRGLLWQLDDSAMDDDGQWLADSVEVLEGQFGKDNIVGFAVHRDETSVHLHVLFVPVYEDENGKCAVSQTKFFKSPTSLKIMHADLRKAMIDRGYDIERENKTVEEQMAGYTDKRGNWHQKGLTPDQLRELSDRKVALRTREMDVNVRQKVITRRESELDMRENDLEAREQAFEQYRLKQQADMQRDLQRITEGYRANKQRQAELDEYAENLAKRADEQEKEFQMREDKIEAQARIKADKLIKRAEEQVQAIHQQADARLRTATKVERWYDDQQKAHAKALRERYLFEFDSDDPADDFSFPQSY